jgi:hypothetical protein
MDARRHVKEMLGMLPRTPGAAGNVGLGIAGAKAAQRTPETSPIRTAVLWGEREALIDSMGPLVRQQIAANR